MAVVAASFAALIRGMSEKTTFNNHFVTSHVLVFSIEFFILLYEVQIACFQELNANYQLGIGRRCEDNEWYLVDMGVTDGGRCRFQGL